MLYRLVCLALVASCAAAPSVALHTRAIAQPPHRPRGTIAAKRPARVPWGAAGAASSGREASGILSRQHAEARQT